MMSYLQKSFWKCTICGANMDAAKYPYAETCSNACRQKRYRQRHRERLELAAKTEKRKASKTKNKRKKKVTQRRRRAVAKA